MATCAVCSTTTNNPVYYTVYSHIRGGDVVYTVCEKCDKHFNHTIHILSKNTK